MAGGNLKCLTNRCTGPHQSPTLHSSPVANLTPSPWTSPRRHGKEVVYRTARRFAAQLRVFRHRAGPFPDHRTLPATRTPPIHAGTRLQIQCRLKAPTPMKSTPVATTALGTRHTPTSSCRPQAQTASSCRLPLPPPLSPSACQPRPRTPHGAHHHEAPQSPWQRVTVQASATLS